MNGSAGRTIMVTGSTSGIGLAIARSLAEQGQKVVMVARDPSKGKAAMEEIGKVTGNDRIELLVADLSSPTSVRDAVLAFNDRHEALNGLINSAAVFERERKVTREGMELMLATNHLGPFLLTTLLLDKLHTGTPARVLTLTAPSTVKMDFDDLQGSKRFRALHAFGATKAANLLFTFALARRLEGGGITANAVFPGVTRTNLMHNAPAPIRLFSRAFSASPSKAAEGIVPVVASPEYEAMNGRFFRQGKVIDPPPYTLDQEVQERLWKVSAQLVGQE